MKKLISFFLAILLVCSLAAVSYAAENTQAELDHITDDAGVLSRDEWAVLEEMAAHISDRYQCGIYAAIVEDYTDFGSGEILDVAEAIYGYYLLGYGPEKDGALLLLCVEDGVCTIASHGTAAQVLDGQTQTLLQESVDAYGTGGYEAVVRTYLLQMDTLIGTVYGEEPAGISGMEQETHLSCDLELDGYVTDLHGLLDTASEQDLEEKARKLSEAYDFGVYTIILTDHTLYGNGDLYTTAEDIYLASGLGLGKNRDGLLLILSMDHRSAALISYDGSGQLITADGKDWLAPKYLEHFREDRWYEGLDAYVRSSETLLKMAEKGTPMTQTNQPGIFGVGLLVSLVLAFLISFVIMKIMESGMLSVCREVTAQGYVAGNGIHLLQRSDRFLHRQTTRRRLPPKNPGNSGGNSGGGSRRTNSRGFSGRTDKF